MAKAFYTMIATGSRTGKTCKIMGRQFVNGKCRMPGNQCPRGVLRTFGVFEEGSEELLKKQAEDRANPGLAHLYGEVPDGVSDDQSGPSDVPEGQPGPAEDEDEDGDGAPEDGDDGSGLVPDGDAGEPDPLASLKDAAILSALKQLDPANDSHWTQNGDPAMLAVESLVGDRSITRFDIQRVAPDFKRPEE